MHPSPRSDFLRRAFGTCVAVFLGVLQTLGSAEPESSSQAQATPNLHLDLTDHTGTRVHIPKIPSRVISLAPSLTESMEALGLSDRLVAVTTFCAPNSQGQNRVRIQRIDTPNIEVLLALQPDLIVATPITSTLAVEQMRKIGLKIVVLGQTGIEGTLNDLEVLGKVFHQPQKAEALCASIRETLHAVQSRTKGRTRPRTLLLYDSQSLYSTNSKTFAGEILSIAGADNIAANLQNQWPQLALETIVSSNPECILICSQKSHPNAATNALLAWKNQPVWNTISAVSRGRVFEVQEDLLSVPGPRMGHAAEVIESLISQSTPSTGAPSTPTHP